MFGKNTPLKQQKVSDYNSTIKIKEIFYTIQGEGPFSGQPAVFIRFANCNLCCTFCDTDFESDIITLSITDILNAVDKLAPKCCNLVVITGGEPFLQVGLGELSQHLISNDFQVQIETAGNLWLNSLPKKVDIDDFHIIVSPKTAKLHNKLESNKYLKAYKYIIANHNLNPEDGLPNRCPFKNSKSKVARPKINNIPIFIQPCDEYDEIKNEQNIKTVKNLALKHGYIAGLQLHKYFEVP